MKTYRGPIVKLPDQLVTVRASSLLPGERKRVKAWTMLVDEDGECWIDSNSSLLSDARLEKEENVIEIEKVAGGWRVWMPYDIDTRWSKTFIHEGTAEESEILQPVLSLEFITPDYLQLELPFNNDGEDNAREKAPVH